MFATFSKTLLTTERRLSGLQFFAVDLSPTFLNKRTAGPEMRPSNNLEKKIHIEEFRNVLKSSANMYENWGSRFFRTATEIQLGPDIFEKSGLVMKFLTNLGVR